METYYNSTNEKRKIFDDVYRLVSPEETINEDQKSILRLSAWTPFWVGYEDGSEDGFEVGYDSGYEVGYKDGLVQGK